MINRINCINFYTDKIAEMKKFYCDVLLMNISFPGYHGLMDGIKFGTQKEQIQICLWDRSIWPEAHQRGNFEISVQGDIDLLYTTVKNAGYPVKEPYMEDWGRVLEILDPEGNNIYIME